ncbi:ornithine-acyl[acyl carrier protein] N-acyltransferase [Loktanella fryxellensis]|uniref:L-ornithine N(alpha)-acyltransferase n=1 Tax=Loktanella fryxellensis TaxID=245187 RepID=A0A1H8F390_9RHOB|nr:GNAT family N-acyltransferase [Loktanella fryxellensis]SEN26126.1 ornithine-acyl[acyl carrier protein] N-acyltransferase [Loktanella fryxellensis]
MTPLQHAGQVRLRTRLADGPGDVAAAQALRYEVFVRELGAGGACHAHLPGQEADAFDPHADHLLLEDLARDDGTVVGVYRMMNRSQAIAAGRFSSAHEFDLTPLLASGRPLLELGRSCLLPAYRGGPAMMHLFAGVAQHVAAQPDTLLFGVASFHGTDTARLTAPLALLHSDHLAPPGLRPHAIGPHAIPMPVAAPADRKAALRAIPPLIKAYLRLGSVVGDGACVDPGFNTTDVCMMLDAAMMTADQRARLWPPRGSS